MITRERLQEQLKEIEETVLVLQQTHELIKHIDLKDYGLRDARKVAIALWMEENKDYRGAVVSFAGAKWYIRRGKEYSFQDYSRIKLFLCTPNKNRAIANVPSLYKDEWTLDEQAERRKKTAQEYRKAIAQYDEYAKRKQEWEEYNRDAPYPLRYEQ